MQRISIKEGVDKEISLGEVNGQAESALAEMLQSGTRIFTVNERGEQTGEIILKNDKLAELRYVQYH